MSTFALLLLVVGAGIVMPEPARSITSTLMRSAVPAGAIAFLRLRDVSHSRVGPISTPPPIAVPTHK